MKTDLDIIQSAPRTLFVHEGMSGRVSEQGIALLCRQRPHDYVIVARQDDMDVSMDVRPILQEPREPRQTKAQKRAALKGHR
jgi:hypothetical protein